MLRRFHETALVESSDVGDGTQVWAYAHILAGAKIGQNCNVGDHSFVESGAVIGDNVTVKNNVCIFDGVTIEDCSFIGPSVIFTNDVRPRSPRMPIASARYVDKARWLSKTVVGYGASIGANATIVAGIRIGRYSMIAAGAVVTKDVEPHGVVRGNPARLAGYVCRCGCEFAPKKEQLTCLMCESEPGQRG